MKRLHWPMNYHCSSLCSMMTNCFGGVQCFVAVAAVAAAAAHDTRLDRFAERP